MNEVTVDGQEKRAALLEDMIDVSLSGLFQ